VPSGSVSFYFAEVCSQSVPTDEALAEEPITYAERGPASVPDVLSGLSAQWYWEVIIQL
jgi:hypothetical protein